MPVQTSSTPNSTPEAKNVEISHSGIATPNTGSWVPKISILDPPSQPSSLWNGNSVPIEFEIPDTVGKLMDAVLMIEVQTNSVTAPATGVLPPTTHWVDSVESFLGSQMIERVVADDLLNEAVLFLSDQELNSIAPLINLTTSGGYSQATYSTSTNYRFYLPLWANSIITTQPYCKGFSSKFKFRINFAPSLYNSSGVANTGTNVPTIVQLKLLVQEAGLSANEEAQLEALHRSKIEYRTVRRNKHVSQTKDFSVKPASEVTEVMTEFANTDSAALLVYARPSGAYSQYPNTSRRSMYEIGLLDGKNTQLVPRAPGKYNEGFIVPWSVSSSQAISESGAFLYLFPFCSNLQRVLESGDVLGGLQLTGNEKLVYINDATTGATTTAIHVESFEYMRIVVNRKASSLVFRA